MDYSKLAAFRARHFSDRGDACHPEPDYIDIVRFFGRESMAPSGIQIRYQGNDFKLRDPLIGEFAREMAANLRAEGRLYDGPPVMKLVSQRLTAPEPYLIVQAADYALQAGTCFALDAPHPVFEPFGGTLRDYYRRDCETPTVDNNPLAICLGVCGLLQVEEAGNRFLLRVTRSHRLASLEGTVGPSVAGVVDYTTDCANLRDLNDAALGAEVEEELHLDRKEFDIVPLAWAIELFRGERPQLFSLINTSLNRAQVRQRLETIPVEQREFDRFDFMLLTDTGEPDQIRIKGLNYEARVNLALATEYLAR